MSKTIRKRQHCRVERRRSWQEQTPTKKEIRKCSSGQPEQPKKSIWLQKSCEVAQGSDRKGKKMAEFLMCAVKDELSETFLAPVFAKSEEEMIRLFDYQINNTPLWKENPSDFSLYKLGDYNEITGEVRANMKKIIGGRAVWRKEENDLQSVNKTGNETD